MFFLENAVDITKGNPCFLDHDKKLRPNLGIGLRVKYRELLIRIFMWKDVKGQCKTLNLQNP